jgi:hypothetical protein
MKDYYQILEITPDASPDAIKEQYRFLVQAWHPDKFPNSAQKLRAEEKLKEINEAYETLRNPAKRNKSTTVMKIERYISYALLLTLLYGCYGDDQQDPRKKLNPTLEPAPTPAYYQEKMETDPTPTETIGQALNPDEKIKPTPSQIIKQAVNPDEIPTVIYEAGKSATKAPPYQQEPASEEPPPKTNSVNLYYPPEHLDFSVSAGKPKLMVSEFSPQVPIIVFINYRVIAIYAEENPDNGKLSRVSALITPDGIHVVRINPEIVLSNDWKQAPLTEVDFEIFNSQLDYFRNIINGKKYPILFIIAYVPLATATDADCQILETEGKFVPKMCANVAPENRPDSAESAIKRLQELMRMKRLEDVDLQSWPDDEDIPAIDFLTSFHQSLEYATPK